MYAEALDTVRDDYVDQEAIDPEKQTYGAIEGMLDTLGDEGPHPLPDARGARAEPRGPLRDLRRDRVQLEERDGEVVVAAPIEGSPAARAGIETGDVVVAVDGEGVREEDVSQIVEKVKGPEGTRVKLTVERDGEERVFDLERAEIESPVASWTMIPSTDVAFVRLSSFSDDSAEKLSQAFEEARAAGARRFILDLRNNPGGRLDQAVQMAG